MMNDLKKNIDDLKLESLVELKRITEDKNEQIQQQIDEFEQEDILDEFQQFELEELYEINDKHEKYLQFLQKSINNFQPEKFQFQVTHFGPFFDHCENTEESDDETDDYYFFYDSFLFDGEELELENMIKKIVLLQKQQKEMEKKILQIHQIKKQLQKIGVRHEVGDHIMEEIFF